MNDIKLFYSYSTKDENLRIELEKALSMLRRYDSLKDWSFRAIAPGEEINEAIHNELESSDIILLLISLDFLASSYCYDIEVKRAIELHNMGKAVVIPVILRECDWKHMNSPLKYFEAMPKDGKPITKWDDLDTAYNDITQSLKIVIAKIIKERESLVDLSIKQNYEQRASDDSDSINKVIELFKQEASNLNYNSSKNDFKNYEDLKRELYSKLIGEAEKRIENIPSLSTRLSDLLFEKIYASEELDDITIQEILKIRTNKEIFFWYDRKIITNSLALSLISQKKFNKLKANILIDFISDFEENVWQTALSGLVLGLIYHQNKWPRFEEFKIRLQSLKEIDKIQDGLNKIEAIFRMSLYDKGILSLNFYSHNFFKNPSNCFLPFYDSNPILINALDNNITNIDSEHFSTYVSNLPFLDCYKYILCLGLVDGSTITSKVSVKETKIINEVLNISYIYHPFQNIISEFYCFLTKYPKNKIEDLFKSNMSITKTKLKTLILNKTTELLLTAKVMMENGSYEEAISKLNDLLKIAPNNQEALWSISTSYSKKKKPDFPLAILSLKKLDDLTPNNSKIILKIGAYYLDDKNTTKAFEYFLKAYELSPDNKDVLIGISGYFMTIWDWEKALEYISKGRKLFPKDYYFALQLGNYYEQISDYTSAKDCLTDALRLVDKDNIYQVYSTLSTLYMSLDEPEESFKYAKLTFDENPKDPGSFITLARAYMFAKTDLVLARKFLEKAARRLDMDITYGNLGHLELIEGNEQKAIEHYKRFAEFCIGVKDFERFDNDFSLILKAGVSSERYLSVKQKVLAYWDELKLIK